MGNKKHGEDELQVEPIALKDIDEGTAQIRTHISDKDLEELKDSIETLGLLQPIVVMRKEKAKAGEKPYSLVIGQRRYLAFEKLNRARIPAMILDAQDREKALVLSLAENMCRSKLSHKDAAEVVTELFRTHGRDVSEVAELTGMWPETVRRYVYVQECGSKKILKLLDQARISLLDAKRALIASEWKVTRAEQILQKMVDEGMARTEKKRFSDYLSRHSQATLDVAAAEARKVRVERRISVDLTDDLRQGLRMASEEWQVAPEDIVAQALQQWLEEQGFSE